MGRYRLLIILFIISNNILWGQTGYKNFSWGMSIESVKNEVERQYELSELKKKYPDSKGWNDNLRANSVSLSLHAITLLRNPSVDNWWGLDLKTFLGSLDGSVGGLFSFSNDKLVSVTMSWSNTSGILQDLIKTYGQGKTIKVYSYEKEYLSRIWQNGDRYIVWCQSDQRWIEETVSYIDLNWINNFIDERYRQFLQFEQEQKEKNKKIID